MDIDLVRKAMNRAFSFGQTYWQQADSESYSQHKKADETSKKFHAFVDETCAALALLSKSDDIEAERKMFEAWWPSIMNVDAMPLHRFLDGYQCHETNRSWMTWQACAILAKTRT